MKTLTAFLSLAVFGLLALFSGCDTTQDHEKQRAETQVPPKQEIKAAPDTTPRVTGIGGIFFGSENPKETRAWYGKNLGLAIDEYGSPFEFRNANAPHEVNYLRWGPFRAGSDFTAPSKKEFMINYRVNNLNGLLKQLKANGVTIVDSIETYDYGKFIHILDPEGNKIELWEPVDSVLTNFGGKTTK